MSDKRVLIRVLGPVDVIAGGRSLEPSLLERNLLAVLSSRMGLTISTERLIDVLWAAGPPRSARNRIQALVSSLRRRLAHDTDEVIVTVGQGYRLNAYRETVDAGRFERLVRTAREHRDAGRIEDATQTYREALELWRGAAFDATDVCHDNELQAEAARLDESRLVVIEECTELELSLGQPGRLVPELTSLVRMYPFRERLRARLMVSLARSGRHSEAIAIYRNGYAIFADELGIEPSADLRELHQAILTGDPALLPDPAPRGVPAPAPGGPRSEVTDATLGVPAAELASGGSVGQTWAVPADLPDFTGRTVELTRLSGLLAAAGTRPVVNISGPGGVGKTTLALRFAHAVGAEYADGCLHVDLRGTGEAPSDPVQVMGSVLRGLGLGGAGVPDDPDARTAVYRSVLAQRSLLLVLDDAVDERQVLALIPPVSRCGTIITSRRALTGVDGGVIVDLDVLSTIDALAMLTNLIGNARVADEPVAASRVVELCGRLPLAIRLIGVRLARAPEQRLAQVVSRLADLHHRLDELAVNDRTVRASIALSYARLDPMAAQLFRLLGLLPMNELRPWVAGALLDQPPPVAGEALARLVDLSLVGIERAAAGVRYRIHDLVRAYGQDRTRADDAEHIRLGALRRLYEGLARMAVEANKALPSDSFPAVRTPRHWFPVVIDPELATDPGEWFDAEHGFLVGAARDAVRLGWFDIAWRIVAAMTVDVGNRGGIDEWCDLVDLVIAGLGPAVEAEARPTLLLALGGMLRGRGHTLASLPHLRQARIGFARLGDANRAGIAACQLGIALRHLGRHREAAAALRWATGQIEPVIAAQHLALAHIGMGNLHLDQGCYLDARMAFARALEVLGPDANPATESNVLVCLGLVATREGRHEEAVEKYHRALRMLAPISDLANAGRVELLLAEAYADHGDLANARRYGERARQTLLDVADVVGQARARAVIGQIHLADGRAFEAAGALEEACDCLERTGHRLPWARALSWLGRARLALHDRAGARAAGQRAQEIYAAHGRAEAHSVATWLSTLDAMDLAATRGR